MATSRSIQLFGVPELRAGDTRLKGPAAQRHRLALLALLACACPRPVSRERIRTTLWPERDDRRSRALLNLAVHVLRRALGPGVIRLDGDALRLDVIAATCDVVEFRNAIATGDQRRAVASYAGPLLDGFRLPNTLEFERWMDTERTALASAHARALVAVADDERIAGRPDAAISLLERRLAADPCDSRAAVSLAASQEAAGDAALALATLERHAATLLTDVAVRPPDSVVHALARLSVHAPARMAGLGRADAREGAAFQTVRARHFVARRDPASLRKAIAHFETACAVDPTYAPAHAGLADAWSLLGFYDVLAPTAAFPRAWAAAKRAIALDPRSPDGHASLGYVLLYYHWDWHRAEREFRHAIAFDPRHAQAHQWLGNCLALLGRAAESAEMMRRSRALAPGSPIANAAYGWAKYLGGDFDRAVDLQLESMELDPGFPVAHLWLGQALARTRRWPEALVTLRRAVRLFGRSDAAEAALARAYAEAGDDAAAREITARLEDKSRAGGYAPAYEVAKIHAALGARERALEWLERAHAERSHSMAFLRVDPEVAALRDDPRGTALVGQMGLA